ncbi:M67 family metallopeptidase [Altererythrobacter sp. SALINAS58]|uniref:Mov34/MPN/PAD-1 family protein n=1 Tax=Alteripontixanthobacter muriae TaxID=2705546 RepID=UPI001575AF9C|nr:M67 family metallopeptidase [Alteripontixanthobacter muriae]NTZ42295.1 M67 family metallopeptidase [Alteripontixanthobacter muriae]
MIVELSSAVFADMCDHAALSHPEEACGLLLGTGFRIVEYAPAANVHPQPRTHFEIDPIALIAAHKAARARGTAIVGYFHSHPQGPARPSATDSAMAAHDGAVWAIWGEGGINFWKDEADGFAALPYRLSDG